MKIIRNIPAAVKVFGDVIRYNKYKSLIDNAKASGDFEKERRLILEAAIETTKKTITDVTPKVEEMVGDVSRKLFSASPESSESIRPPSPSAS